MALVVAALVAATASAAMAGPAGAGELVYKGCTAAISPVSDGKKVCSESGLNRVYAEPVTLALSPDGSSLYTGSGIWCDGQDVYCYPSATVGRFSGDSATGSLDYRDCVTGIQNAVGNCKEIPGASPDARGSGLGDVYAMVVSPDGKSLYAASPDPVCGDDCFGGNALARFDRDPATGAITYRGCITGDKRSGPSGSGACSETPDATADGSGSGLAGLQSLALSADGKWLYGGTGISIVRFRRDPQSGALTYRGCITGDKQLGPSGSGACAEIPGATDNGRDSGLWGADPVLVSRDGTSVYVGGADDGSIAQFDRDPATGSLSYVGCIASEAYRTSACSTVPGRFYTWSLEMSPDSGFVYAQGIVRSKKNAQGTARSNKTVAGVLQFRRDSKTGALTYVRTVKGPSDVPYPDLAMALGADGSALYTGSYNSREVSSYTVSAKTGRLRYAGCLSGDKGDASCTAIRTATGRGYDSGLEKVGALAASGRTLYAYSTGQANDIAHFTIAPETWIGPTKTRGHRAVLKFRANPFSKFECKLKGKHVTGKLRHWRQCGSHGLHRVGKQVYRHLRPGKKIFRVRATDRSKTTDPTPAKKRWHVH
jgi:hypothetical protein